MPLSNSRWITVELEVDRSFRPSGGGGSTGAERIAGGEGSGKSAEALKAQMEKEGDLSTLRAQIREEKVLDLLKANASIELT